MESSIVISSAFLPFHKSKHSLLLPITPFSETPVKPSSKFSITANYSSNRSINPSNGGNTETPFAKTLRIAGKTLIFTVAATLMASKFSEFPAKAEPLAPTVEKTTIEEDKVENFDENESGVKENSSMSHLLESNSEFVENLWSLLQKKLENKEDEEALEILDKLVEAQPSEIEWKYIRARLLREMGEIQQAKAAFEEILRLNPLSFEASFEKAVLKERGGETEPVIGFLKKGYNIAMDFSKAKEDRDVRLTFAQSYFLVKRVDKALRYYDELIKEDPKDFRPYFCKGMIYRLLDRNSEAKEQFAKYKELSPKKYEVERFYC